MRSGKLAVSVRSCVLLFFCRKMKEKMEDKLGRAIRVYRNKHHFVRDRIAFLERHIDCFESLVCLSEVNSWKKIGQCC